MVQDVIQARSIKGGYAVVKAVAVEPPILDCINDENDIVRPSKVQCPCEISQKQLF